MKKKKKMVKLVMISKGENNGTRACRGVGPNELPIKRAQHGAGMIKIRNRKTTEAVWISRNVENAQKC